MPNSVYPGEDDAISSEKMGGLRKGDGGKFAPRAIELTRFGKRESLGGIGNPPVSKVN